MGEASTVSLSAVFPFRVFSMSGRYVGGSGTLHEAARISVDALGVHPCVKIITDKDDHIATVARPRTQRREIQAIRGVDTKGLKLEVRMRRIALHVTGTNRATFVESEGVWYLGAGYWRACVNDDGAIRLVNPSVVQKDIEIVEQAVNILS